MTCLIYKYDKLVWLITCMLCMQLSFSQTNDKAWTTYTTFNSRIPDLAIVDIQFDKNGNNYLGFGSRGSGTIGDQGYYEMKNGDWKKKSDLSEPNYFMKILVDDTVQWESFSGNKLTKYINGKYSNFFEKQNDTIEAGGPTTCVMIDNKKNIWCGTQGAGVYKYIPNTDSWFRYTKMSEPDLISNTIYCLATDSKGQVWMGSDKGLSRWSKNGISNFNTFNSGIKSNQIYSIAIDKQDVVWILASDGLYSFDGVNWTDFDTTPNAIPGSSVKIDSEGNIWIVASYGGIYKFDKQNLYRYGSDNSGINTGGDNRYFTVYCLNFHPNGDVWIGTSNGLAILKGGFSTNLCNTAFKLMDENRVLKCQNSYSELKSLDVKASNFYTWKLKDSLIYAGNQISAIKATKVNLYYSLKVQDSVCTKIDSINTSGGDSLSYAYPPSFTNFVVKRKILCEKSYGVIYSKYPKSSELKWYDQNNNLISQNRDSLIIYDNYSPRIQVSDSICRHFFERYDYGIIEIKDTVPQPMERKELKIETYNICKQDCYAMLYANYPAKSTIQWLDQNDNILSSHQNSIKTSLKKIKLKVSDTICQKYYNVYEYDIPIIDSALKVEIFSSNSNLKGCENGDLFLKTNSLGDFTWNTGEKTAVIYPSKSGFYSLTVKAVNGCIGVSNSLKIKINPQPIVSITAYGPLVYCDNQLSELISTIGVNYLWNDGSTTRSIKPNFSGEYFVKVTDINGCSNTSNHLTVNVEKCSSIQDNELTSVQVYPNPTNGIIHIKNLTIGDLLNISDINGRVIYTQSIDSPTVNLSMPDFSEQGVYYLNVFDKNRIIQVYKVVFN